MINLTPQKLLNLYGISMADFDKADKEGYEILKEYIDKKCIIAFGNKKDKRTLMFILKTKEEYKSYIYIFHLHSPIFQSFLYINYWFII